MQLNNLIHMIYDNTYDYDEPIVADCALISNNANVTGKVKIKRDSDHLHFIAENWEFNKLTEVSGKGNSQVIEINKNTIPMKYKCEITNFPVNNRNDICKEKDIKISLHSVMCTSNFTISMGENKSSYECDLIPLYDTSGELGKLISV